MHDERNPPETSRAADDVPDRYRPTDRLVARLAELRSQLEVLAPQDQDKGREAIERIRQAQERIEALEEMLSKARDLEQELTAKTVRDRAQIFRYEAEISELSATSARVSTAEEARRQAEAVAAESERASALGVAELDALRAEIVQLRSRNTELEADLVAVTEKLAAAAVARAEAVRLKAERDEARERAQVERRLAAQDRRGAAEAGHRAAELQHELREAERRMVQLSNKPHRESIDVSEDANGVEVAEIPPPWIELQRASSEAASVQLHVAGVPDAVESASPQDKAPLVMEVDDASSDTRDVEVVPPTTELIDLTATGQTSIDEGETDEDAGADYGSTSDGGWAAPDEKIWQLLRGRGRD
jgi:chromosome segregation ATPase